MFLTFEKNSTVSVFETNIRALGGLLSIYQLTEDSLYLEKAKDLGDRLLLAFDSPSKFPHVSSSFQRLRTRQKFICLLETSSSIPPKNELDWLNLVLYL